MTIVCCIGLGCGASEDAATSQAVSEKVDSGSSDSAIADSMPAATATEALADTFASEQESAKPDMAAEQPQDRMEQSLAPMAPTAELSILDETDGTGPSKGSVNQKSKIKKPNARRMANSLGDNKPADFEADSSDEKMTRAFGAGGDGFGGSIARRGGRPRSQNGEPGKLNNMSLVGGRAATAPQSADSFDLQPGEELWVIAKPDDLANRSELDVRGCGSLLAKLPKQTTLIPVPLSHTEVEANVDGYIATVDVTQQFQNPYESKIEATYVFPLPHSAAVNEFVMTVGDRKIRGIIREREKAEKIYETAKNQGYVASLMTQERANIFTQKVANIEPGKQIDIHIRYFNTLQYDDGAYEFVFPMVVGPRYNPPGTTDGVGAVARNANGSSGQKTEVAYLAPTERSGHDISLSLNINAGVNIEEIQCVNHDIEQKPVASTQRRVTLSAKDSIPNKDFVLRYKVAGDQIKTAILTHEDNQGKYFTMMLYPPADLQQVERSPMEMVFVLDCSGSMRGKPLGQVKNAIAHALQTLTPRDTFQIIQFSSDSSQLGAEPVIANEQNIQAGLKYLYSLNGGGGTQMIEGIKAALDFPHDEGRFRLVSFMTDGAIGNDPIVLQTLSKKLGASRVFSFGVGSSPNRLLMDRMAILGKGAVAYLSLNDDAADIMDRFNKRISHPAMTDLQIDWGTMDVADVYPQRLPDLIVGRPVVVTGRFKGKPGTVKVHGRVAMQPATFEVEGDTQDASKRHPGVAAVWARLKIKDMMNTVSRSPQAFEEIKGSVTRTALAYNLMSSFTAFVAVDSMSQTKGELGTTVAVPVTVPDGVQYDTTVGDGSDE